MHFSTLSKWISFVYLTTSTMEFYWPIAPDYYILCYPLHSCPPYKLHKHLFYSVKQMIETLNEGPYIYLFNFDIVNHGIIQ